jgi:DNA invertase Pin-like site-specific DNA recombinase
MEAGIYVRISRAKDGSTLGVERQEPPCRDLCIRKGWGVHKVYCDNDLSAYSGRKRPDYQQMLQDARDGVIRAIVAWDADRLTRRPIENEDLIELCEKDGIAMATVSGEYDLATSGGRMHFRIKGAIARHESEHRAERVALKHAELRAAGKFHGGQRGFGHRVVQVIVDGRPRARVELDEPEAEHLRAAAKRVLHGGAISAIVKEWNTPTSRVRRPKGRLWDTPKLRELLTSPRIAGLRQSDDELVDADWPAIIDRETWEQLRVILGERPTKRGPKEPREYLGSNIYLCDLCGTWMLGQARMRTPAYACRRERGGCGRLHRMARPLDDYLRDELLDKLASPKFRAKLEAIYSSTDDDLAAELVARRDGALARLKQLRDLAGDPTVEFDVDDFAAAKRNLDRVIDEATAKLAELPASNALADLPNTAELLAELWERAPLDRRRALVRLAVDVVILKAPGGGRRFQPSAFPPGPERDAHVAEHVQILWRA